MKKIKSIMLIICSALLILGGCQSSKSSSSEDVVELRFMFWGGIAEQQSVQNMVEQFNKENPNIKVIPEHVPDEYETRLVTLMASGDLPDVAYVPEALVLQWGIDGHILDLTKYEKDYPELANRIPETYLYYDEGKHLGNSTAIEVMNLYYNKDAFKEAGVEPPPTNTENAWTWDEFLTAAKKLTIDRNGNNALSPDFDPKNIQQFGIDAPTYWAAWYPFVRNNGGDIASEKGTEFTMNQPEAVEALQLLQDLIHKHHVAPTPTQQADMPQSTMGLDTKRFGMLIDGQWSLNEYKDMDVNFGIGVLPKMKEAAKSVTSSGATSIFASTKHPEEALKFYLYHNDPEIVNLYEDGLWMPVQDKYYKDQKFMNKWLKDGVHPPEYKEAVIDYTLEGIYRNPAVTLKNWSAIRTEVFSTMDLLWLGQGSAQELMDKLSEHVNPLLEGRYPTRGE